ncbi:MAG: hypothetical protein QOJ35_762 [Solirubrobacteraceae bacterium]|jgi:hypothetical protein|nr:hypothetical protein [Solirubrobacteraceae bacterium]
MPTPRSILAAASSASVLVFAPPAGAATVTTDPCVRTVSLSSLMNMPITGAGFTPGGRVTVRYATKVSPQPTFLTAVTADAAGNFTTAVTPPLFNKFNTQEQTFSLGAFDESNPALVATTTWKQVRVGYITNPPTGKPTRSATHTVRGFPVGKATYLHFRFGGKTRRNVRLGVTSAPCGKVSRRLDLLPTRSRPGKWTVYVDQAKAYHKGTRPQLKYSFVITRTFG